MKGSKNGTKNKNKEKRESNDHKSSSKKKKENNWQDSEDYLKHLKEFSNELKPFGMMIRDVKGDGNCLFRSISDQLEGTEEMHLYYRKIAVEQMTKNKAFFKNFLFDIEIETYISEIAQTSNWGGNLEIQAISQYFGHNFVIHIKESNDLLVKGKKVPGFDKKTIHLAFHNYNEGEEHYSSVRNIGDDDEEEPATEIKHEKYKMINDVFNKDDSKSSGRGGDEEDKDEKDNSNKKGKKKVESKGKKQKGEQEEKKKSNKGFFSFLFKNNEESKDEEKEEEEIRNEETEIKKQAAKLSKIKIDDGQQSDSKKSKKDKLKEEQEGKSKADQAVKGIAFI